MGDAACERPNALQFLACEGLFLLPPGICNVLACAFVLDALELPRGAGARPTCGVI